MSRTASQLSGVEWLAGQPLRKATPPRNRAFALLAHTSGALSVFSEGFHCCSHSALFVYRLSVSVSAHILLSRRMTCHVRPLVSQHTRHRRMLKYVPSTARW
eukprot:6477112-Amphidinium_carterae.3